MKRRIQRGFEIQMGKWLNGYPLGYRSIHGFRASGQIDVQLNLPSNCVYWRTVWDTRPGFQTWSQRGQIVIPKNSLIQSYFLSSTVLTPYNFTTTPYPLNSPSQLSQGQMQQTEENNPAAAVIYTSHAPNHLCKTAKCWKLYFVHKGITNVKAEKCL